MVLVLKILLWQVREYITKVAAPDSPLAQRVAMLPKRHLPCKLLDPVLFLATDAHTLITDPRWRPNAEPLSWLALHFLTPCPSENQPILGRTSHSFSRHLAENSHGFLQFLLLAQRCDLWRHDGSPGGAGFDPAAGHANDPRQAVHSLHWKGCAVAVLRVCSSGHWPLKFVEVLHASNFCGNPFGLKLKIWRGSWDPPLFDDACFSPNDRVSACFSGGYHHWPHIVELALWRAAHVRLRGQAQWGCSRDLRLCRMGSWWSWHALLVIKFRNTSCPLSAGLPRFLILVSLQRPLDNFLKASSFGS